MNWFLAKIVYRIVCGEGIHQPQFEEQLRLIQATCEGEALVKAKQIGLAEEVQFSNQQQQLVQWRFINVSEVYLLQAITDGAEVYSRIEEKEDAALYESIVHSKASFLEEQFHALHLNH